MTRAIVATRVAVRADAGVVSLFARSRRHFYWLAVPAAVAAGCVARSSPSAYVGVDPGPVALPADVAGSAPLQPMALAVGVAARAEADLPPAVVVRTVTVSAVPPPDRHVVAAGETLIAIARDRLGDAGRWRDIAAANPDVNPSALGVGKSLILPH